MSCMYSSSSRGVVSLATPPLLIKLRQKEKEVNLEQKKEIYLEGWAGGLASLDMVDIGSNPPMSCWSSYNHKLFFVTAKTPLRPVAMVKRAKGNHPPPPRFASSIMPGTLKAPFLTPSPLLVETSLRPPPKRTPPRLSTVQSCVCRPSLSGQGGCCLANRYIGALRRAAGNFQAGRLVFVVWSSRFVTPSCRRKSETGD